MTQSVFGQQISCSGKSISRIEDGKLAGVSIGLLESVAALCGFEVEINLRKKITLEASQTKQSIIIEETKEEQAQRERAYVDSLSRHPAPARLQTPGLPEPKRLITEEKADLWRKFGFEKPPGGAG